MLIFASHKLCVCGQKIMLYCFTGMISESMAVVGGTTGDLCPGYFAISRILSVALVFALTAQML